MLHVLTTIDITQSTDSLDVYRLAFESARTAGLTRKEQLHFARAVSDFFFISHSAEGSLQFLLTRKENGDLALQAHIKDNDLLVETVLKECPASLDGTGTDTVSDYELVHYRYLEMEQRNRDLQQFTFSISHELKNSLTKLKLSLSLLEMEHDPDFIRRQMAILRRSAHQLEETMLGLNEIIQQQHNAHPAKKISLAAAYDEVIQEFDDKIKEMGAVIRTDLAAVPELFYIDTYIKSIFRNLLGNAIKYTSDQRRLEVSITAVTRDGATCLSISDNGQGIDLASHGKKLFHPFSRFSNNPEGKGLGLYIIKNMVERNGGNIRVESELHSGTTFHVTLVHYN